MEETEETPEEREKRIYYNLRTRAKRTRVNYERLDRQLKRLQAKVDKSYATWARADDKLYHYEKERGII